MNCNETHLHLVDAVDRHLPDDLRSAVLAHLKLCDPCRSEYELQLLAKQIVTAKLKKSPTPDAVRAAVIAALDREASAPPKFFPRAFIPGGRLAAAFAAGAAVLLLIVLLNIPATLNDDEYAHTSANDIINRSVQNFSLVRSGELKPSMIACYPDIVVGYFEEKGFDFAVSIPVDDSCDWYGAVSDTYDGVKQAHIMYKRGDDLLYVFEVNKNTALPGSTFSLPAAARKSLAETGWYTDPQHRDCNVVLWTVDETLCAAVSTMGKDQMLAVLTAK
ncbi:MAG: zf-HC2 domain-containing protein [Bacteroidota bacterium]